MKNMEIRHDIESQHLQTKIKLVTISLYLYIYLQLQDTLTKRNQDFDFAEDNNRQLLSLLEKYDNKLDELQEDLEIRELKIIEYEKDMTESQDKIKIESIEDKINFITNMLERLKEMHKNNVRAQVEQKRASPRRAKREDLAMQHGTPIKHIQPPIENTISSSIDKLTNEIMIQI